MVANNLIKYYFNVLMMFLVVLSASAQNDNGRVSEGNRLFGNNNGSFAIKHTVKHQRETNKLHTNENTEECVNDTASYALYMNSVKQYGWMRGLGEPITDEHASHLSHYFRFSQKNKAGHWTKVENLNGYGELENGSMGTYLVNPFDDDDLQIDENWRNKLKQIVCWELIGDITGEKCIQENAYDKEGNLVYSYIPVQVGANKYMGHFVDAWGMPAQFRNEKEAKFVVVKWDDYGYETEVAFIGEDGFPMKNSWGAYIAKYLHDKEGFTISNMSCAADGSYMRDRSGNSGQKQTCDKYGNSVIVTNYDENNEIIRIDSDDDWIQYKIEYDSLGREKRRSYQLTDGTPDKTKYGIHGFEFDYNEYGQVCFFQRIGLDGLPQDDKDGISSVRRNYDKWGNEILFELRDKNGKYRNNNQNVCLVLCQYEEDKLMWQKYYQTTTGYDTLVTYHFYRDGYKRINKYVLRDEIDIFIDDVDGNNNEEVYYTLDWTPRMDSVKGYHHYVENKSTCNGVCKKEGFYYDINNKLVAIDDGTFKHYMLNENSDVYNHFIIISDSLNLFVKKQYFDNDKLLLQFMQPRSSDFEFPMGEIGLDIMGEKSRTHFEKALYYNAYTGRTIKNHIAYLGITNEYGEIAYGQESDADRSRVYAFRPMDGGKDLDESGEEITNSDKFRTNLPKAYIIEVYDSLAMTKWGIKSGDVVMKYGEWVYPEVSQYSYHGTELYESFFSQRNNDKELVVMRRDPETNTGNFIIIPLCAGMPKDYGFFVYPIMYTQKEKVRYENCFKSFTEESTIEKVETYKSADEGKDFLFFRPLRTNGNKRPLFEKGVTSEGLVLGHAVMDKLGNCERLGHKDLKDNFDRCRLLEDRQIQKIWFTTDLETIQSVEITGEDSYWGAHFWLSDVDIRISRPSQRLYKKVEKMMETYTNQIEKIRIDSLQKKYGQAYKAVDNDSVSIHIGRISGDTGYMVEQGYDGLFVVLEWCGWKCTDINSEFSNVFEKNRKKKKDVLLIPVKSVNDQDVFGDIIRVKSAKPLLGLRMSEMKISFSYFKNNILDKYIEWSNHTSM